MIHLVRWLREVNALQLQKAHANRQNNVTTQPNTLRIQKTTTDMCPEDTRVLNAARTLVAVTHEVTEVGSLRSRTPIFFS